MNNKIKNGLICATSVLVMGVTLGYLFFVAVDKRLQQNEKLYTTKKDELVGVFITCGEEEINATQKIINEKEKVYGSITEVSSADGTSSSLKFSELEGEVYLNYEGDEINQTKFENMIVSEETGDSKYNASYKIDLAVNINSIQNNLVTYINPIFKTGENVTYVSSNNCKKVEYNKNTSAGESVISSEINSAMYNEKELQDVIKVGMFVNITYKLIEQVSNGKYYVPISALGA